MEDEGLVWKCGSVAQEEALAIRESLALASIFHPQVTTTEEEAHGSVVIAVIRKANHAADWIAKADRSTVLPSNWVHNQLDSPNNFLVSASKGLKGRRSLVKSTH